MRVALTFPGCHRRGGVERVMFECANFLAGRGHEVSLHASEWGDMTTLDRRVRRVTVSAPRRPTVARLLAFERQIRNLPAQADVVGGFGVLAPPGSVVWAQSVHAAWVQISRAQRDWKGRLRQRCNPMHPVVLAMERAYFGGRRYGHMVALTDDVRADLARHYSVPSKDVEVIPNGFAPVEFDHRRALARRAGIRTSLGYSEADRVVIFVANELERKGFGPLLRAVATLRDPRVRLLAVGRLDSTAYATEVRRLGMEGRVIYTGPTEDVSAFYAAADAFALPTQYEAWGLVIVEAMACGLPVLTSRLAGAAVAVTEGKTGELVEDPRDHAEIAPKLARVIELGRTETREYIAASVERYAWPRVLERYETLLEQAASKASSSLAKCTLLSAVEPAEVRA